MTSGCASRKARRLQPTLIKAIVPATDEKGTAHIRTELPKTNAPPIATVDFETTDDLPSASRISARSMHDWQQSKGLLHCSARTRLTFLRSRATSKTSNRWANSKESSTNYLPVIQNFPQPSPTWKDPAATWLSRSPLRFLTLPGRPTSSTTSPMTLANSRLVDRRDRRRSRNLADAKPMATAAQQDRISSERFRSCCQCTNQRTTLELNERVGRQSNFGHLL